MKYLLRNGILLLIAGVIFNSCNNHQSSRANDHKNYKDTMADHSMDTMSNMTSTPPVTYPYTIEHPDYWETGNQQNTLAALKSLKAWENKNIDESLKYFADSVHVQFDGFDKMVSKDSLKAMITSPPSIINQSIKMQDWESVISKDKKDEYVTLWYRQYMEDKKGRDSMDIVNDLKMKDGKIIGLDQYVRKLH